MPTCKYDYETQSKLLKVINHEETINARVTMFDLESLQTDNYINANYMEHNY